MHLPITKILPAIGMASFASALRSNLRSGNAAEQEQRSLQGRPVKECTVNSIAYLQIPGEAAVPGGDEQFGCDDGETDFVPLDLDETQVQSIRDMARDGALNFGLSKIDVSDAVVGNGGAVKLPPGKKISVLAQENNGVGNLFGRDRRQLQAGTGNKHFLLFRVTDMNGLVHAHDAALMSDNMYGTDGDTINLKSQLKACSVDKYTVVPGGKGIYDTSALESAPGVIDIVLDTSIDDTRTNVRTSAMNKAKEVLGNYFGLSTSTSLTTYADHTLFSLKQCFQECGWAAYAGVGSYYQFYQGGYYAQAGVQLHEHGHNMQLAHSGGLDGQTYTDHTCAMGNPLYGDDSGRMCFNPAKNWQMQFNPHQTTVKSGWYDSADFITVDTAGGAQTIKMIGVGEYDLQGDGVSVPRKAIALQVQTGTTPQYIAFNSAKGANIQNDEADNEVTIMEKGGTGYSVSSLKAHLTQGQSYTTTQGRIVTAECINTAVTPSLACVCVRESGQTCPTDCACTDAPVTDQPTNQPTSQPTSLPTNQPTLQPTQSPVPPTSPPSSSPTKEPTPLPTKAPVTPNPTNFPSVSPTSSPSVSPTTAPPTTSPSKNPTNAPSVSPTSSPSVSPTTAAPTTSPSASPTQRPVAFSCSSFNDVTDGKNLCKADVRCQWQNGQGGGSCIASNNEGPTPTPPPTAQPTDAGPPSPTPPPTPPTTGCLEAPEAFVTSCTECCNGCHSNGSKAGQCK